jgi:hypothetical protein
LACMLNSRHFVGRRKYAPNTATLYSLQETKLTVLVLCLPRSKIIGSARGASEHGLIRLFVVLESFFCDTLDAHQPCGDVGIKAPFLRPTERVLS